jgi:hypothetical protein
MPSIQLKVPTNLSAKESFERIKKVLENDSDLKKLDSSYVCQFDEKNCSGSAKGSKFSANLTVADKGSNASEVNLKVEFGLLLTPFKSMIENTLNQKIAKALA